MGLPVRSLFGDFFLWDWGFLKEGFEEGWGEGWAPRGLCECLLGCAIVYQRGLIGHFILCVGRMVFD